MIDMHLIINGFTSDTLGMLFIGFLILDFLKFFFSLLDCDNRKIMFSYSTCGGVYSI